MTDNDFETEVRQTFRRRFAELDPLVVNHALEPRRRPPHSTTRFASLGLLAALALVVAVAFLGPWRQAPVSASPSARTAPTPSMGSGWQGLRSVPGGSGVGADVATFWQGGMAIATGGGSGRTSVLVSTDGRTWTAAGEGVFGGTRVRYLVANGTTLVAVGELSPTELASGEPVWISSDGRTWTPAIGQHPLATTLAALAGGPAGLVGVDGAGFFWHSPDGREWSHGKLPGAEGSWTGFVTYGGGRYLIVQPHGGDGYSNFGAGMGAWTSTDGEHWAAGAVAGASYIYPAPFWLHDRFVAYEWPATDAPGPSDVGSFAAFQSFDGLSWTRIADPPFGLMPETGNGYRIVASQLDAQRNRIGLMQTTDGEHWSRLLVNGEFRDVSAVLAAGPSGILTSGGAYLEAIGMPDPPVPASTPEPTSVPTPVASPTASPTLPLPAGAWSSVAWSQPMTGTQRFDFVAAGTKGVVAVTRQAAGSPGFAIVYSHDGANFLAADTSDLSFLGRPFMNRLYATPWGFLGLGIRNIRDDGTGEPIIWFSEDGTKWSVAADGGVLSTASISGLAWSDKGLVAVGMIGNKGYEWSSSDGRRWTSVAFVWAQAPRLTSIAWSRNTGWLLGGGGSFGGPAIWHSTDATDWTRVGLRGAPTAPATGQVTWLHTARDGVEACGNPGPDSTAYACWTSANGTTWSDATPFDPRLTVVSDGTRMLRSDGLSLEQSFDAVNWFPLPIAGSPERFALSALAPDGILVATEYEDALRYLKAK